MAGCRLQVAGCLALVLVIGMVSAVSVCIDNVDPSVPAGLSVSGEVGNILLVWGEATDEPDCSGIDEYVIFREGFEIGRVSNDILSFVDNESLGEGEYVYTVYAIDMIGRNTGSAIMNVVKVKKNIVSYSGGGSSSGTICVENWSCGEWSECVGYEQRRLCEDLSKCGAVKNEPEKWRECGIDSSGVSGVDFGDVEFDDEEAELNSFLSMITGAVTGVAGTTGGTVVSAFVVLMLAGLVAVRVRKNKVSKKGKM